MQELADRLNPRACFDALYQRAALRLRDEPALRQAMQQARLHSSRRLKHEQTYREQQKIIDEIERTAPVWSFAAHMQQLENAKQSSAMQYLQSIGIAQPSKLKTRPMGTRLTGGNLMSAVLQAYSPHCFNQQGQRIQITRLHQHIPAAYALTGAIYPLETEINNAVTELRQAHNWRNGPVQVIPPNVFTGHLHDREQGQMINREIAYLPPVHSAALLLNRDCPTHALGEHLLLIWFATEYGISDEVRAFIGKLDWATVSTEPYNP